MRVHSSDRRLGTQACSGACLCATTSMQRCMPSVHQAGNINTCSRLQPASRHVHAGTCFASVSLASALTPLAAKQLVDKKMKATEERGMRGAHKTVGCLAMWASALQACAPQYQQLLAALTMQLTLHQAKPGMLVIKAAASRQC